MGSYVLVELIRINFFKKDNNALLTGLISMLLLGFSLYLWIKYGLTLDYGSEEEIYKSEAELMYLIALIGFIIGFGFILISILKMIIWKIKKYTTMAKKS